MHRNKSVDVHQFAMIPRAEIPRSSFRIDTAHKTTFDSGFLIPVYVEEVLPGDTFNVRMTAFCRLSTPIVPVMDNLYLESFFFFVPNRLVWTNWQKFMGQQTNPGDSISYTVPTITTGVGGWPIGTLADYMGLPTAGQVGVGNTVTHQVLPLRGYNLIYNEWFRDENLQTSVTVSTGDGPDATSSYDIVRRGKRHDYFTSCLPFLQKGTAVSLPLGTSATVKTSSSALLSGANPSMQILTAAGGTPTAAKLLSGGAAGGLLSNATGSGATGPYEGLYPTNLYADLSTATAATINQIRLAFQTQKLLERDARGGTRYTEIVRSHFGVISPDARLQRPEYLGGGASYVNIRAIPQTSGTGASGTTTPTGFLAAAGDVLAAGHGFTQSFTEHGYVIGLVSVRADLAYQQGLRRHWSRSTRYDYYFPVFAMLGEQAVLNKEIYFDGSANDALVFGYQERWAEYRYYPSYTTNLMRSTATGTLDVWHLAQKFTALPTLNTDFIKDTPPVDRITAVTPVTGKQLIGDFLFNNKVARPLPMFSVPGLIDHF